MPVGKNSTWQYENSGWLKSQRVEAIFGHETDISAIVSLSHLIQRQDIDVLVFVHPDVFGSGQNLVPVVTHT